MMYTIIDHKATTKHSYFGARSDDTLLCPETGKEVTRWETAANDFLSRYMEPVESYRGLLVAMDMGQTYREAFFPGYKANRLKRKEEQSPLEREQMAKFDDWAKKFLVAIGATLVGVEGVEADDVIAWLVGGQGVKAQVHTVDADLIQLVSETTAVSLKGEWYYAGGSYKNLPTHVTSLMKSMVGDASDGYKGVPGFGPKAFEKLMAEVGVEGLEELQRVVDSRDLDTLQEAVVSRPESKELAKLEANWVEWMGQWRLAKLHPELCWKPRGKKLTRPTFHKRVPHAGKAKALLEQVGAGDFFERIQDWFADPFPITGKDWDGCLDDIKAEMTKSDIVAFDYESTDYAKIERFREASSGRDFVDVLSQQITGVSFCFGEFLENLIYVPVDHADTDNVPLDKLHDLMQWIKDEGVRLVAQNFAFEGALTEEHLGISLSGVWDTRIMQRYVDENASAHLKDMSKDYLGYNQATYSETLGDKSTMAELTLAEVFKYGTDDSLVTAHLTDLLQLRLRLEHQWDHYAQWAVEPAVALRKAFLAGVNINWPLQKRLAEKDREAVKEGLAELRKILHEHTSEDVTKGCESYIEAEKTYMKKRFRAKYDDKDEARKAFSKWKHKLKSACVYVPFSIEEVMPPFAFTPKQLSAAAEAAGLPAVEKVTRGYLGQYLEDRGLTKDTPDVYEGKQKEFLDAFQKAVSERVDKLPKEETFTRKKAFEELAEVCQRLAGVEPKQIKTGDELNVGSSDQMKELIYCKIGVPVRLFGLTVSEGRLALGISQASPATDEKAIQMALANDVSDGSWQEAALKKLLEIKTANTRNNLFHKKMPMWVHEDGRVHPYITDSGTDTRRPTGSSPNILQIPGHGAGSFMRSMYMPPGPEWVCVAIDFSSQELRLLACESGDPAMLEAYDPSNPKDLHSLTGVAIAKKKVCVDKLLAGITEYGEFNRARKDKNHPLFMQADAIRAKAKTTGFGLAYGAAAPTLSRNLSASLAEAEDLLDSTLGLYSRIQPWQEETGKFMDKHGYTVTAFGTRRHAKDDIFSSDNGKVSRQHRQGVNFTIQGCAAESLKTILTKLHTEGWLYKLRMQFFAPIYDEVVAWVHKDDALEYWHVMKRLMTEATPPGHVVPQVPELSIGGDWGNCEELGSDPSDDEVLMTVAEAIEAEKGVWGGDMRESG